MSHTTNDISLNLDGSQFLELQPVPRFVSAVLQQALRDGAQKIEFSLVGPASEKGFRIRYSGKLPDHEMAPIAVNLFDPVVVVLCNHASISYYAVGRVRGILHTRNPDLSWLVESDNLKKHVVLQKT